MTLSCPPPHLRLLKLEAGSAVKHVGGEVAWGQLEEAQLVLEHKGFQFIGEEFSVEQG